MLFGERERNAGLHQVVANRYFAAKRIAPPRNAELVQIVGIGLNQNGHVEACQFQCVGHSLFVAKIRQHHDDARNLVAMILEKFGAFSRVGMCFDAAEF